MSPKMLRGVAASIVAGVLLISTQHVLGDGPLKYQFKGMNEVYYQVSIKADMPDSVETKTGMIVYQIKAVDPANGQISFGYASHFTDHTESKTPNNNRFPGPPPMPPFPSFPSPWGGGQAAPEIMISPQGTVLHTNRADEESQLPHMLGLAWQLVLPVFPSDNKPSWKEERSLTLYVKNNQRRWPPPPPWERQPEERVDRPAHETVTYSAGQASGTTLTITRQYELATDEKIGNSPLLHQSGQGQIVFDTSAGLVKSMEMNYVIEANQNNISVKIPLTVNARLFTADEVAKYKADQAEQAARQKVENEKAMARRAQEDAAQKAVETGTIRTPQLGYDSGGGPYVRADAKLRPVLGFRIVPSTWGNAVCFRMVEPLYEKPASSAKNGEKTVDCFAKPGYAVGGLVVNCRKEGVTGPAALQVIFMKIDPADPNKLQTADQYRSVWVGAIEKTTPKVVLGGKGDVVLGIFGRQGLNTDAIGLILKDPKATSTPTPSSEGEKSPDEISADALPTAK